MSARDRSRSPYGGGADDVASLVWQREQARLQKDWALADQLREALTQLGVTLSDQTKSWKATDGRTGRIPTWSEIEGGQMAEEPEARMPDSNEAAHIKHLVQQREQARAGKDFPTSDKIRDELKSMGVDLFDKEKMWRSKSGDAGVIIGYRGSGGPTDTEITILVVQRERARQSNDWRTADMIRDELKQFGVDIFDKDKAWRTAEGRTGQVPSWGAIAGVEQHPQGATVVGMAPPPRGMAGPMNYGVDLRSQVVQAALAASSNPANAQRTLHLLQGVGIGGCGGGGCGGRIHQAGVGRAAAPIQPFHRSAPAPKAKVSPAMVQQSGSPEAQEAIAYIAQCQGLGRFVSDTEIEWLVTVREKLRQNKDFQAADEVRNAMRSTLGLELHEKEKRWTCTDGRQGAIPLWGSFG